MFSARIDARLKKSLYLCNRQRKYTDQTILRRYNIGLPQELLGLEGHSVTIKMHERGGCLSVQQAMSMTYSHNRSDYPELSDAAFANARRVKAGKVANGVLHRSSSPFDNKINRNSYVSAYLESEGVKTVLNLSETEEEILAFDRDTTAERRLRQGIRQLSAHSRHDPATA